MDKKTQFSTLKGYELNNSPQITYAMEDYLEMICRLYKNKSVIRINELADMLNVRPSSASKMVSNLKQFGLVSFERYGFIQPTEKGIALGEYLLYRHDVLNEFLCMVNNSDNETEQVEKIEHFLNPETISNIKRFVNRFKDYFD